MPPALPLPPLELRELVGVTDPEPYDNPTGAPIFDGLAADAWRTYLDFGCGCGRSARRLMQQAPRPQRYIGVDLHRGMVRWCQENLAPLADGFESSTTTCTARGLTWIVSECSRQLGAR